VEVTRGSETWRWDGDVGRSRREIEELIGFFVNTLVIRVEVEGEGGFRELLGRVRESSLGAQAHEEVPFERLVDELKVERDPSRTPLFQVIVRSAERARGRAAAGRRRARGYELPIETAKFDLFLDMAEVEGTVWGP